MAAVEETIKLIEERGDTVNLALTLHGGCVPIVIKDNLEETVTSNDLKLIFKARDLITRIHNHNNIDVIVCAMALESNGIDSKNVLPFVRISEDSFIETIQYQNDGYALIAFP
ncbi:MAG: DsrE family protein [Sulfuricurvum sp.]